MGGEKTMKLTHGCIFYEEAWYSEAVRFKDDYYESKSNKDVLVMNFGVW